MKKKTDDDGMPTWELVLIIIGGVLIVCGTVFGVILYRKKSIKKPGNYG